jgi:hypothetical protein
MNNAAYQANAPDGYDFKPPVGPQAMSGTVRLPERPQIVPQFRPETRQPSLAVFSLDEVEPERSVKFSPMNVPTLHALRSAMNMELAKLAEQRAELERKQSEVIERLSYADAQIFALRDAIGRFDAVASR